MRINLYFIWAFELVRLSLKSDAKRIILSLMRGDEKRRCLMKILFYYNGRLMSEFMARPKMITSSVGQRISWYLGFSDFKR